jgi:hypothetical protein
MTYYPASYSGGKPMPGKMTWLKAGGVHVHVGVGQKKLRVKMVFPEDVTRRLFVQLERKLKSGK